MNESSPEDVNVFLSHHGVKGMRWGVRRDREGSGEDSNSDSSGSSSEKLSTEELKRRYMAIRDAPLGSTKKQALALAENKANFAAKFEDPSKKADGGGSDPESEGFHLTSGQKKAIVLGAAFAGVALYAGYKFKYAEPNSPISPGKFQQSVLMSQAKTWTSQNYIKPSSFDQEEFTLPAGHVFHRISMGVETNHNAATYAVPDIKDFNRYVVGFRGEKGPGVDFYHTTFKAEKDIRIPSLVTRLETMKEVLNGDGYRKVLGVDLGEATEADAMRQYKSLSGKGWNDPVSTSFIKRLSEKGYHGIIDDMDAGVIGDKPLVLFSPDLLGPKSAKFMGQVDIEAAERQLVELAARK